MTASEQLTRTSLQEQSPDSRPRIGFLGLGWIGRQRLRSLAACDVAEIVAIADPNTDALHSAQCIANTAAGVRSLEELLECDLDGLVIATPSAQHAEQSCYVLEKGVAVFCQKPLGRAGPEVRTVVDTARRHDCLLAVDFCYRHVNGLKQARTLLQSGQLGTIYFVDLVFHNAYGPDKPWFYDRELSGGGCVVDLGSHLIDLAAWMLGDGCVRELRSTLWERGQSHQVSSREVEDTAVATWNTIDGALVRLACSWNLHAGQDAVINASFYGTKGAVTLRNLDGSFYDLVVEHCLKTQRHALAECDSQWGSRGLFEWTERLARGAGFDPEIESVVNVARIIDEVYGQ